MKELLELNIRIKNKQQSLLSKHKVQLKHNSSA